MLFRMVVLPALLSVAGSLVLASDAEYLPGHDSAITDARLSPDGKTFATVAGDGKIVLRDASSLGATRLLKHTESAFTTFCFTADSKYLLATGNLEDLGKETDGFMRYDLETNVGQFVNFPVLGSIKAFNLTDAETHVSYICARKLCRFDLANGQFANTTPLPRSITGIAVSPDSRLFAFQTSTEVPKRIDGKTFTMQANPCRLVMFTPSGEKVFESTLPEETVHRDSALHFVNEGRFVLCQGKGQILQWERSKVSGKWETFGSPVPTSVGYVTALCNGLSEDVIWLGAESSLIGMDLKQGKVFHTIDLKSGESNSNRFVKGPITHLTLLPEQKQIVVSFWSGGIASVSIER